MTAGAPIVVGIDGSASSLDVALWAAEEAVRRETSLRLVAIGESHDFGIRADNSYACRALKIARDAITVSHKQLDVDAEIVTGDPAQVLAAESARACLVCLSAGQASWAGGLGGYSLASRMAHMAASPVIVVRRHPSTHSVSDPWVVAVIDDVGTADPVLTAALAAARRRHADVMVLMPPGCEPEDYEFDISRRMDATGMDVWVMPRPQDLSKMLLQASESEQLVVVSADHPQIVDQLTNSAACSALRGIRFSVLVLPCSPLGVAAIPSASSSALNAVTV